MQAVDYFQKLCSIIVIWQININLILNTVDLKTYSYTKSVSSSIRNKDAARQNDLPPIYIELVDFHNISMNKIIK